MGAERDIWAAALVLCTASVFLAAEPIIPRSVDWRHQADETQEERSATVIDERAIEESGASELTELLRTQGFYVTEGAAGSEARITIGGLTAQNIHVYVDGILQNTATYGRFDWNQVDLSQVERITIYKAGFCPLPEAASFSGAVICIQTRSNSEPRTVIAAQTQSYSGSAFDTNRISASRTGVVKGSDANGEVLYKATASMTRAMNDYCLLTNADASLTNATASVTARRGKAHITADARLQANDINVPPQGGQAGEEKDTSCAVTLSGGVLLGGAEGINAWELNCALHYQHTMTEWEGEMEEGTHKLDTVSLNADVSTPVHGMFCAQLYTKQTADILHSTQAVDRTRWSGVAKTLFTISPYLPVAFDVGITADIYGDEGASAAINPLCALRFDSGALSVAATYARLYQCPTMYQLYWASGSIKGNSALEPEWGNAWQLIIKCDMPLCPIMLDASYARYHDKIRYGNNTFENLSSAHILSGTVRIEPTIRAGAHLLKANIAYTYTAAKILGGESDGNQIMDVPEHTAAASAAWKWKMLTAGINGEYVSKRYVSNWNAESIGQYFLCGAFIRLTLPIEQGGSVEPYFKVSNVTDVRVWSDYTRTIRCPPRSVTCGVRLVI